MRNGPPASHPAGSSPEPASERRSPPGRGRVRPGPRVRRTRPGQLRSRRRRLRLPSGRVRRTRLGPTTAPVQASTAPVRASTAPVRASTAPVRASYGPAASAAARGAAGTRLRRVRRACPALTRVRPRGSRTSGRRVRRTQTRRRACRRSWGMIGAGRTRTSMTSQRPVTTPATAGYPAGSSRYPDEAGRRPGPGDGYAPGESHPSPADPYSRPARTRCRWRVRLQPGRVPRPR